MYKEDTRERKKATIKEAEKIFANLAAGEIKNPKTQQEYVGALNRLYQQGKANIDGTDH